VNYRPLAAIIQPKDLWVKDRVVLVGDSAHATTPHLASGAGIAVEGGIALAEELSKEGRSIEDSLSAYVERRYERCRDVIESSVDIGKMQLNGASPQEVGGAIGAASHRLIQPF
jgi:2-polyprenyl-6-methoxyphenol hydroxylase-like FAD-dependent oxidoreductase